MRHFITILATSLLTSVANGQTDGEKDRYNVFNPVPKDKMRDMETDRPDATESAYTVAAGHFQVESDLFKQVRNRNSGFLNIQNVFNLANLKMGLTENIDIQFVVPTYVSNKTREVSTNNIVDKTAGFDDITLRLKYNIWGNAGGKTAFAVLPFLSFPTSSFSNNRIQGGIIFPFAVKLKEGLNAGTQAGIELVKEDNNRYYTNFVYSVTVGKSLFKKINSFAEALTTYSSYTKNTDVYINGGLIYAISENLNIDAGVNYGINKGTDTIFFSGFSFRY